jgi:FKBP-type peptidyl-prolyl cis-trans isomerase
MRAAYVDVIMCVRVLAFVCGRAHDRAPQPQANFLPEGAAPKQKDIVKMPGLQGKDYGKTTTKYPDFTATESGVQYKDVKVGSGETPQKGDRVVYDWEGYTIGDSPVHSRLQACAHTYTQPRT